MNISTNLRWMLLLTVGACLVMFFQDDEPEKKQGTHAARTARMQSAPQGEASDAAGLGLPDQPSGSWPRQRLGSQYGWEPLPAAATPPAPSVKVLPPSPPPIVSALNVVAIPPAPVQALTVPVDVEPPKPKFPYQMVGLLQEEKALWAWLVGSTGTRAVVQSQVIDEGWRVEAIGPSGMLVRHLKTDYALHIPYTP